MSTGQTPEGPAGRRGVLVVLSAPSGAGKTTLVRRLLEEDPNLRFSVSWTTRPPRPGEQDGHDYRFVSAERFAAMRAAGAFLEHAEVFGNHYGTGRAEVEALLDAGHDVLLEIDWQGARQIRTAMPECCSIFILPPSIRELERRLRGRGTDSETVIRRRLDEALADIRHWDEFDHAIINERIDDSVAAVRSIIATGDQHWATHSDAVRQRVAAVLDAT